jgi:hypothetical protein
MPRAMKALLLILMIGLGVSTVEVKRSKRNDPTSELYLETEIDQLKAKIATVGVELTKIGTGFSFQKVWNQVIAVKLPTAEEYMSILNSMELNCLLYEKERYQVYDNPQRADKTTTVADIYYLTLTKRCTEFQEGVKRKANNMIVEAFANSLPQPQTSTWEVNQLTPLRRVEYVSTPNTPLIFNVLNDDQDTEKYLLKLQQQRDRNNSQLDSTRTFVRGE